LPQLPRTRHGKVDLRALPAPEPVTVSASAPRSEAEAQLAAIWREVLGLDTVGVTDNFFELGGHSLLALRLVSMVNQRLGWPLTLPQLLRHPTIRELAKAATAARPSPLVQLNGANDARPPLFCLPPAGGTVFPYLPLARALAGQRRVYGLMCPGLYDPDWLPPSLDVSARDYANLILQAQPQGPYHLLGWSLGGALAMEVAHLLEQAGAAVAFLGLVDSYVPGFDDIADQDAEPEPAMEVALLETLRQQDLPEGLAGPAGVDLAHAAAVTRLLSELAEAYRVKPLRVAPHCWWSDSAAGLTDRARATLEAGWGREAWYSGRIPEDHLGIVRSEQLLSALAAILNA
jgi:thioesterase domain-containing protein/acyl carrier protein